MIYFQSSTHHIHPSHPLTPSPSIYHVNLINPGLSNSGKNRCPSTILSNGHTAITILICHISGMTPIPVPSTIIVVRQIPHNINVHLNCLKMMGISVRKLTLPSASFDVAPQDLREVISRCGEGCAVCEKTYMSIPAMWAMMA